MVKGFPVHKKLSEVSPNNPVFLRHASGHAAMANAKAMEVAGVNQLSIEKNKREEGEGGEVVRDALGNPTGLFNERAMDLIDELRACQHTLKGQHMLWNLPSKHASEME